MAYTLHYTTYGQGTPIILLHGFPFHSGIWKDQAVALSDSFQIITPDLRGFGGSLASEGVYEMETFAQDVLNLMDTLRIEKAAILGHSMGGYVTFALWQLAAERFLGMGLVATHAWADTEQVREGREATISAVMERGTPAIVEAMLPRLFAPHEDPIEAGIETARSIMLSARPVPIMNALRGMMRRPDSSALLPHINVPTLIMTGDEDAILPPSRAEDMAKLLPNATLVTIEHSGHMPMLEQPGATSLAIQQFMQEVKRTQENKSQD